MDGGGWGAVALATPQQSGSTPLLVKYPHLRWICSYLDDLCGGKGLLGSGRTEQLFPQPLCFTLMALSAPLVIRSGSACKKVAPATAVLWACLCWVTTWRRSRSQNAMWPWGLPDAKMGGPSDRERERLRIHGEKKRERDQWARDYHLYLFWRRACWLVPSPAWSSLVFHPIGCCEWWCGPSPCQRQPRLLQDSEKGSLFFFILNGHFSK